jgi:hypothetical protein
MEAYCFVSDIQHLVLHLDRLQVCLRGQETLPRIRIRIRKSRQSP